MGSKASKVRHNKKITVTLSTQQYEALGAAVAAREQTLMEQRETTEAKSLLTGWEKIKDEWVTTKVERLELRRQSIVEDATFLAQHGVGATEAARRLGFTNVNALDKYLHRARQYKVFLRLVHNERGDDLADAG
jgi:hypothetical protein